MVSLKESQFPTAATATVAMESPLKRLPPSMVSEVRRIALSLGAGRGVKSLAVLGLETSSGVSSIASILACVIAESGEDVVVLDASASQSQPSLLRVDSASRSLPGEASLWLTKTPWPRLRVATPALSGPAGLKPALRQAVNLGGTLVVDCAAISDSFDAVELASAVQAALLVLKAGTATKDQVQQMAATLRSAHVTVGGVLINRIA